MQAVQEPLSSLQVKVEPGSLEVKEKLALVEAVPAVVRKVIVVFGGAVSTGPGSVGSVGSLTGGTFGPDGSVGGCEGVAEDPGTEPVGGVTTGASP